MRFWMLAFLTLIACQSAMAQAPNNCGMQLGGVPAVMWLEFRAAQSPGN
jgi:hypothetical protein